MQDGGGFLSLKVLPPSLLARSSSFACRLSDELILACVHLTLCLNRIDLPTSTNPWLTSTESEFLELSHIIRQGGRNIDDNDADVQGGIKHIQAWSELKAVVLDRTMWAYAFVEFCASVNLYGNYCSKIFT